jgi:probable rRNA maturation factor
VIKIEIHNRQNGSRVDRRRLAETARAVLRGEGIRRASVGIALVDDDAIQELNRRWLAHDRPTDVISFLLERSDDALEGEVAISAQTAKANARRFGWSAGDELLLCVVHGILHLAGYDDGTPADRRRMREREREHLGRLGLMPRYEEGKVSRNGRTGTKAAARRQAARGTARVAPARKRPPPRRSSLPSNHAPGASRLWPGGRRT